MKETLITAKAANNMSVFPVSELTGREEKVQNENSFVYTWFP